MESYFGGARDGGDLRVDVRGFWVIFHDQIASVMQQRLTMNCVLHLHHLLQVTQLKAFSLERDTHARTCTLSDYGCSVETDHGAQCLSVF